MNKNSESTHYSNYKFSLAYENYLSVFILNMSSEEKEKTSFHIFPYDYISTNYNDNMVIP